MINTVIFDLDCTLADRRRSIDAYADRFLDRFGKALDGVDRRRLREVLVAADGGGYNADARAGDIVAGLDWAKAPTAKAVDRHWHDTFPDCAVIMDDAYDVLDELREAGLGLGILTNGTVRSQETKIACLDLEPRVDAVVVSEAVGAKKPDARIFEAALDALDTDADEALYVGDHPVNDVQGATDAGLTAAWLRGWQEWPADLTAAEFVIDGLAEVPALVEQLAE